MLLNMRGYSRRLIVLLCFTASENQEVNIVGPHDPSAVKVEFTCTVNAVAAGLQGEAAKTETISMYFKTETACT